jgi:hypothetical protein
MTRNLQKDPTAKEILDYIRGLRDRFGFDGDDPLRFYDKRMNEGAFSACCHILDHFDPSRPGETLREKPEETFATGRGQSAPTLDSVESCCYSYTYGHTCVDGKGESE